jgi:CDP-diacylglycerol--glycerol-3-phosphate 3-phosphatidyltransferase
VICVSGFRLSDFWFLVFDFRVLSSEFIVLSSALPSIYDLKPKFQNLLRPLTRALAGAGVTANHVTLAALLLSAATGACIQIFFTERWPLVLMGPVLFVRMALNAMDGMLAREHGMKSPLGAMLNEIGDVTADAALYLPLALVPGFDPMLVVVAVVLGILTEMAGVVGVQIGASRRYDGPFGKSDRAFVFGAMSLLAGLGVPRGPWITIVLAVMILLLTITVFNRTRKALQELKR